MTTAKLRELRAKATNQGRGWQHGIAGHAQIVSYDGDDIVPVAVIHNSPNREFIVAAVNALPALADLAELAARVVEGIKPGDEPRVSISTHNAIVAALAAFEALG